VPAAAPSLLWQSRPCRGSASANGVPARCAPPCPPSRLPQWSPTLPGVFSTSSFDGKLAIHNVLACTGGGMVETINADFTTSKVPSGEGSGPPASGAARAGMRLRGRRPWPCVGRLLDSVRTRRRRRQRRATWPAHLNPLAAAAAAARVEPCRRLKALEARTHLDEAPLRRGVRLRRPPRQLLQQQAASHGPRHRPGARRRLRRKGERWVGVRRA
jgi:hypothetical protein